MNVDISVKELFEYQGESPKPEDFEAYWQKGLEDLETQSLDFELEPAEFTSPIADCYHLYFTGIGGARIHCKLIKPKGKEVGPGLALFHGYHADSGDWMDKLAYAAHGITVIAMDCRGQGGLSEDNLVVKGPTLKGHIIRGIEDQNSEKLYYRNVFLDTVQTVRILMSLDTVDSERIAVHGASQGGALTTVCAALEPRVKLAVPVYPFLSDYKRAWNLDVNTNAYEEIAYYFRFRDPRHLREAAVFERLGYIDVQNFADRIKAKVIMATGLIDTVCPPSTQFAVYNKIQSEKEVLFYPEYGHEYLPGLAEKVLHYILEM